MSIELTIFILCAGFIFVRYLSFTAELAIQRREKMISAVNNVVHNEQYSEEFKNMAIFLFHASLMRNLMPAAFWAAVSFNRGAKEKTKEVMRSLKPHERKEYFNLLRKHVVPVNAYMAPHWYLVIALGMFCYLVFIAVFQLSLLGKAKIKTAIESIFTGVICRNTYC